MKRKLKILLATFLLSSSTSFTQTLKEHYGYHNLDSAISSKTAISDIESNKMKIFGQGGISPVAYSEIDSFFEVKYKVKYILFGCEAPYDSEAMQAYNEEIGKYLDKKNGKSWRKELHPDVIALCNPIEIPRK